MRIPDSFTIQSNKIYTSYYALACKEIPDNRLVAISIGIPNNFKGNIYRKLNPSSALLSAYKSGRVTEEEYAEIYYNETLSKLNPKEVYEELKGKVLLCYCGRGKFCHRILVLNWLEKSLGSEIIGEEL